MRVQVAQVLSAMVHDIGPAELSFMEMLVANQEGQAGCRLTQPTGDRQ